MTIEEHKNIIGEIALNLNDQAKVTTLLAELSKDYSEVTDNLKSATKNAEELIKTNEELRSANMKLFTQIGSIPKTGEISNEPNKNEPTPNGVDTGNTKELTYENLFDEKGEIK